MSQINKMDTLGSGGSTASVQDLSLDIIRVLEELGDLEDFAIPDSDEDEDEDSSDEESDPIQPSPRHKTIQPNSAPPTNVSANNLLPKSIPYNKDNSPIAPHPNPSQFNDMNNNNTNNKKTNNDEDFSVASDDFDDELADFQNATNITSDFSSENDTNHNKNTNSLNNFQLNTIQSDDEKQNLSDNDNQTYAKNEDNKNKTENDKNVDSINHVPKTNVTYKLSEESNFSQPSLDIYDSLNVGFVPKQGLNHGFKNKYQNLNQNIHQNQTQSQTQTQNQIQQQNQNNQNQNQNINKNREYTGNNYGNDNTANNNYNNIQNQNENHNNTMTSIAEEKEMSGSYVVGLNDKSSKKRYKNKNDNYNIMPGDILSEISTDDVKKMRHKSTFAMFEDASQEYVQLPELSGWVLKLSAKGFGVWQRRWVVVKRTHLLWSKKRQDIFDPLDPKERAKWQNSITLLTIKKVEKINSKNQRKFDLITGFKVYHFRALNKEDRDRWVDGLNLHLHALAKSMTFLRQTFLFGKLDQPN